MRRNRCNKRFEKTCNYCCSINNWQIHVYFNNESFKKLFDDDDFEERISLETSGKLISTSSKKVKEELDANVIIFPDDGWYEKKYINKESNKIGNIEVHRKDNIYAEETILFRVSLPTKSYGSIKDYLSYSTEVFFSFAGSELNYRKGDIYSFEFNIEFNRYLGII